MEVLSKPQLEANKVAGWSDARIVKDCKPKPIYYNERRKVNHRPCLFCGPPADSHGFKSWRGFQTLEELEVHFTKVHQQEI